MKSRNRAVKGSFRAVNSPFRVMKSQNRAVKGPFRPVKSHFRVMKSPFRAVKSPFRPVKSPFRPVKSPFRVMKCPFRPVKSPFNTMKTLHRYLQITIAILEINISIMTSATDFETSLSAQPNPVQFVKTLTGSLHRSAETRENVSSAFIELKIQNHLSIFPIFYKCKFFCKN